MNMSINAQKANKLSKESELKIARIESAIWSIEEAIKTRCNMGDFFARYYFKNDEESKLAVDLEKILKENGFEVELESDETDENIEDIYISWG